MICAKCGANVADGVKFCGVCGQPMPEVVAAPVAAAPVAAPVAAPKKSNPLPIIIIAVVAVVAVILGGLLLLGGGGAEGAFATYFEVAYEGDFSNIEDLQPALAWAKASLPAATLESTPGLAEKWQASYFDENYAFIDSYDYEILLTVPVEGADLLELQAEAASEGIVIDEACTLYVEITYENAYGDEEVSVSSFGAVKYEGDWYIERGSSIVNSIIRSATSTENNDSY